MRTTVLLCTGAFKFCGTLNMGAAEGHTVHYPKM